MAFENVPLFRGDLVWVEEWVDGIRRGFGWIGTGSGNCAPESSAVYGFRPPPAGAAEPYREKPSNPFLLNTRQS